MKIGMFVVIAVLFWLPQSINAQTIIEQQQSALYRLSATGKLRYSKDDKGNRIPDFSHVGYHSGEQGIPNAAVKITLKPQLGDDTKRIQDALDKVGRLPLDQNGLRGAVLLTRGIYRVEGKLVISQSGTVLRGEGSDPSGTTIIAAGYDNKKYKRTLITVGNAKKIELDSTSKRVIVDKTTPIGSNSFEVDSVLAYAVGDKIVVYRASNEAWIKFIGGDQLLPRWRSVHGAHWVKTGAYPGWYYRLPNDQTARSILQKTGESWSDFVRRVPLSADGKKLNTTKQWQAGRYDFYFERKITGIEGRRVFVDAPIVHSMEPEFGGGAIFQYQAPARVTEVGIERVRLMSEFGSSSSAHPYGDPKVATRAENHGWTGIHIEKNTENTWVRNITGNYFGWSLVSVSGTRSTIQDSINLGHASRVSGGRRYSFMVDGQLNLVQRCLAISGRHEFVTQARTAGPNVFVDCIGMDSKAFAGPHHRYSIATLFDNVSSEAGMESRFRGNRGTGHGWAGTQTYFYNCVAPSFKVQAPPGGVVWLMGSGAAAAEDIRAQPASLYYQQVRDRLGQAALDRLASKAQRQSLGSYRWAKERLKAEGL